MSLHKRRLASNLRAEWEMTDSRRPSLKLCCHCGRVYDSAVETHDCRVFRVPFRCKISFRSQVDFGIRPPWYMKLAYTKRCERKYVFYLIPFNYVVNILWRFHHLWNRWRMKPSWIDLEVEKIIKRNL